LIPDRFFRAKNLTTLRSQTETAYNAVVDQIKSCQIYNFFGKRLSKKSLYGIS